MNSDKESLNQLYSIRQKLISSFKSLNLLAFLLVVILVVVIAGMGGYLIGINTYQKSPQAIIVSKPSSFPQSTTVAQALPTIKPISNNQPAIMPTINLVKLLDVYAGWKIFTSPMEGFTIRYPDNWTVKDNTLINCGFKTGIPALHNDYCRDSFDFISPDGLIVRYVIYSDQGDDKIECGFHSPCGPIQYVDEIESSNVGGSLGVALLVKSDKYISLHKPVDSGTMPIIGPNKHSNYDIAFSLPSKLGGRFAFFTTESSYSEFYKLTKEQYYNHSSVKQAILILKSLKY